MKAPAIAAVFVLLVLSGCFGPEDSEGQSPAQTEPDALSLAMEGCRGVFTAFLVDMEWAQQQVPEEHRPQPAAGRQDLAALDQYLMECDDVHVDGNSTGGGAMALSYIALDASQPANVVYYAYDLVVDASPEAVQVLERFSDRLSTGQFTMTTTPASVEVSVDSPNSSYALRMAPRADTFVHFPLNDTIIMDSGRFWVERGDEQQNHLQPVSLTAQGRLAGAAATNEALAGVGREWRSYYAMTPQPA